jgi:hypothetical protein
VEGVLNLSVGSGEPVGQSVAESTLACGASFKLLDVSMDAGIKPRREKIFVSPDNIGGSFGTKPFIVSMLIRVLLRFVCGISPYELDNFGLQRHASWSAYPARKTQVL